jgi:hypothetical protein
VYMAKGIQGACHSYPSLQESWQVMRAACGADDVRQG